jgi:hypothetical protein
MSWLQRFNNERTTQPANPIDAARRANEMIQE